MEARQLTFDPKSYYKQSTMNFAQQNDDMDNDDLLDDEIDATPSTAHEESHMRHKQISGFSSQCMPGKNECDIDMEDDEETKEEPTIAFGVPVVHIRQASKAIT